MLSSGLGHCRAPLGLLTALAAALTIALSAPATSPSSSATPVAEGRTAQVGLFPDTRPKHVSTVRHTRSTEVGLRVRTRTSGAVGGVQFYKSVARRAATPRKATVWTSRGKRLGAVRIPRTAGRGWSQVTFETPVKLRADRSYVISVFAPRGRYPQTTGGRSLPVRGGGLVARHGVRVEAPASRFPRRVARSTNFWIDPLFIRDDQTPTDDPTTITETPSEAAFPTQATTGVPAGWIPKQVVNGTHRITQPGAVVEDIRVNGSIEIAAPDVTLRRVEVVGGGIDNFTGPTCQGGLLVEDTTIRRDPAGTTRASDPPALGAGSFTARRVEVDGLPEGFRVGGRASGCGPVLIEGSWARVVRPDECGDWHGDGIQGYDGPALTVRRTSLILDESGCGGTAPFFYPAGQGNTSVDIDGLLIDGGGYGFRLGTPGTVRGLAIVKDSWYYGPINVRCSALSGWQADIVTVSADGDTTPVRPQSCNTEGGN